MIRVCIVADSSDRADALARQLEEDDRFEIVSAERADVILCLGIPPKRIPLASTPVVAISNSADEDAAFNDTLKAWLPVSSQLKDIAAALVAAAAGMTVLTGQQTKRLFRNRPVVEERLLEVEALTAREQEVLQMMAAGLGNKEIAARLGISPNTAKFHVRQILAKLEAESRTEAVSRAIRLGLVPI